MMVPSNGWFTRENPIWKWMMTGGTPISGNHHMNGFRQNWCHIFSQFAAIDCGEDDDKPLDKASISSIYLIFQTKMILAKGWRKHGRSKRFFEGCFPRANLSWGCRWVSMDWREKKLRTPWNLSNHSLVGGLVAIFGIFPEILGC